LQLLGRVRTELRARGISRTGNDPAGDYSELLASRHFGVDLIAGGSRIQVKGRRPADWGGRVKFWSALHGLKEHGFDEVVAVVLNPDYGLREAYRLPWSTADRLAQHKKKQGWVLPCTAAFLDDPDVQPLDLSGAEAVAARPAR
jgi:hypothetical protein